MHTAGCFTRSALTNPARRALLVDGSGAALNVWGVVAVGSVSWDGWCVRDVEPLTGRWVRLTFADGAVHDIDLAGVLEAGGVLASIRDDRDIFEAVAVDHEFGTITWPGDIDLDPDVLRGDQAPDSGTASPRRVIQPA